MITSSYTVNLDGAGPVDVTVSESGEGRPFLLLHGGGGPDTVARFGETLAAAEHVRVLIPVHPGFGGTPRPEALHSVRASPRCTSHCWTSSASTTSRSSGTRSAAGSPPRSPSLTHPASAGPSLSTPPAWRSRATPSPTSSR